MWTKTMCAGIVLLALGNCTTSDNGSGATTTAPPAGDETQQTFSWKKNAIGVAAPDGSVVVYNGPDVRRLVEEGKIPSPDIDHHYAAIKVGPTLAAEARQRQTARAADRIVSVSMCDAANDVTITEHYAGQELYFWGDGHSPGPREKTFKPGDASTYGTVGFTVTDEGEFIAAYELTIVRPVPSGGCGFYYSGGAAPIDATPEDPLVPDCRYVEGSCK
jgi:hypothetical protein